MSMVLLHVTRKNIAIKKQLTYATDFVEAIILWFSINNCIVTLEKAGMILRNHTYLKVYKC